MKTVFSTDFYCRVASKCVLYRALCVSVVVRHGFPIGGGGGLALWDVLFPKPFSFEMITDLLNPFDRIRFFAATCVRSCSVRALWFFVRSATAKEKTSWTRLLFDRNRTTSPTAARPPRGHTCNVAISSSALLGNDASLFDTTIASRFSRSTCLAKRSMTPMKPSTAPRYSSISV